MTNIVAFDQPTSTPKSWVWQSRDYLFDYDCCLRFARVRADAYTSLTLTPYFDGVAGSAITVTSDAPFIMPSGPNGTYRRFSFGLAGNVGVKSVTIAETIKELQQ